MPISITNRATPRWVIPRFDEDGTADSCPAHGSMRRPAATFLLLDQRLHGKSGGSSFGFGYLNSRINRLAELGGRLSWHP